VLCFTAPAVYAHYAVDDIKDLLHIFNRQDLTGVLLPDALPDARFHQGSYQKGSFLYFFPFAQALGKKDTIENDTAPFEVAAQLQ
jgi:hypothetical protein